MSVLGKHSLINDGDAESPPLKKLKHNNNNNSNNHNNSNTNNNSDDNKEEKGLTLEPEADANLNEMLILNVGGIKYTTTVQTITSYNSILKSRFSGVFSIRPNQDGTHFIDRNGNMFDYILEYFRTGELLLPKTWNQQDIWKFYIELKYYMITSLFTPVLLKLFDSKLLTNQSLKMQLIDKLKEKSLLDDSMEKLKTWKLIYEYDVVKFSKEILGDDLSNEFFGRQITNHLKSLSYMHMYIGHSLVLIQSMYKIYGLFVTMRTIHGIDQVVFTESFAFDCGTNSAHLAEQKENIHIKFREVRSLTVNEKDKNDKSYQDIAFLEWYPVYVRAYDPTFMRFCGILDFKYFEENGTAVNDAVRKMEIWSIPL